MLALCLFLNNNNNNNNNTSDRQSTRCHYIARDATSKPHPHSCATYLTKWFHSVHRSSERHSKLHPACGRSFDRICIPETQSKPGLLQQQHPLQCIMRDNNNNCSQYVRIIRHIMATSLRWVYRCASQHSFGILSWHARMTIYIYF